MWTAFCPSNWFEILRAWQCFGQTRSSSTDINWWWQQYGCTWLDSSRCTSIGEKSAPATVLPNSCVATPNYARSKISFVQDTLCTRITEGGNRSPSAVLWMVYPQRMRADDTMFSDKARCHAERRAFLVSQLMPITKLPLSILATCTNTSRDNLNA